MPGLAGQLAGKFIQFSGMVDIVVEHIFQQRHGLGIRHTALGMEMLVMVVVVVMVMVVAIAVLVGVSMGMLVVMMSHE